MGEIRKMSFHILTPAHIDVEEIFGWYLKQSPYVASAFLAELQNCYNRIRAFPDSWGLVGEKGARRCILNKFNNAVLYKKTDDAIVVFAVIDMRSNPTSWKEKINKFTS